MSRLPDALPSDAAVSPALRTKLEHYADQGGLLGTFTYFFASLETDGEDLAATLASIPTDCFAASALHDDAIDQGGVDTDTAADEWSGDRKRRLNEHISAGDLVFANVIDAVEAAPADVDLTPVLETIREIGAGQLAEETFDATTASVDDAIARVEARGSVWGDLAADLVGATGSYSETQLESVRTIATNGLFVLTIIDDLADLPADIDNDVATLPLVCFDGDPDAYRSTEELVDAVLASDVPDRLRDLVDRRRAAIDAAAADLWASLEHSDRALLDAAFRALTWYRESVCSVPVAETVPSTARRALREHLTGDAATRRAFVADRLDALPIAVPVDPEDASATLADLPDDRLVRTAVLCRHVGTLADSLMPTTLDDALAELRGASTATP